MLLKFKQYKTFLIEEMRIKLTSKANKMKSGENSTKNETAPIVNTGESVSNKNQTSE